MNAKTRIVKDPQSGWKIEVAINGKWYLKRWTAGTKRDALKAEAEVRQELVVTNTDVPALSTSEQVR